MKVKNLVILSIIVLIMAFGIYSFFNKCDCKDVYLGVCFDESSSYYMSNLDKQMTVLEDWKIVNVIKFMEENKVIIYGRDSCSWCQKQLNKFGDFAYYLHDNKLYIDCDKQVCKDISSTPTWKIEDKLLGSGYISMEDLFNFLK